MNLVFEVAFGEHGTVFSGLLGGVFLVCLAFLQHSLLLLDTACGDKTLDLWCDKLAWLDFAAKNKVFEVGLGISNTEKIADLASTLWAEAAWNCNVGKTLDILITLLKNNKVKSLDLGGDDATTNGLALAFSVFAWAVA